ncbi:MAG: HEPN domain-containing protein [Thermomicrobiales bacterium]
MKQTTAEWVAKAEEDFEAAQQLFGSSNPLFSVACFHAQQSAEKYLKSYLQEHEIRIPFTHDLDALAATVERYVPELAGMREAFERLTTYAVDIRYPGAAANQEEAEIAIEIAATLRRVLRDALGLESGAIS